MICLFVGGPVRGLFKTLREAGDEVRVGFDPADPTRAALYKRKPQVDKQGENFTLAAYEFVGELESAESLIDFVTEGVADEQHE